MWLRVHICYLLATWQPLAAIPVAALDPLHGREESMRPNDTLAVSDDRVEINCCCSF